MNQRSLPETNNNSVFYAVVGTDTGFPVNLDEAIGHGRFSHVVEVSLTNQSTLRAEISAHDKISIGRGVERCRTPCTNRSRSGRQTHHVSGETASETVAEQLVHVNCETYSPKHGGEYTGILITMP